MPVKLDELYGRAVGGIYAISDDPPEKRGKKNIKIGRTISFKNRLNAYHTCFNQGFYIYALLPMAKKEEMTKDSYQKYE